MGYHLSTFEASYSQTWYRSSCLLVLLVLITLFSKAYGQEKTILIISKGFFQAPPHQAYIISPSREPFNSISLMIKLRSNFRGPQKIYVYSPRTNETLNLENPIVENLIKLSRALGRPIWVYSNETGKFQAFESYLESLEEKVSAIEFIQNTPGAILQLNVYLPLSNNLPVSRDQQILKDGFEGP